MKCSRFKGRDAHAARPTFGRFAEAFPPFCGRALSCAAVAVFVAVFGSGCASPYWQDRRADAADVFTATVGVGLGATARIGPLHGGLGGNFDLYGIEAGNVGELGKTIALFFNDGGHFAGDYCLLAWGKSRIALSGHTLSRGKQLYSGHGPPGWIPFWDPPPADNTVPNHARWTQIEVAAGLGYGVRLGFNPGELLDFILGFFGIDIYGDDLHEPADWRGAWNALRRRDDTC